MCCKNRVCTSPLVTIVSEATGEVLKEYIIHSARLARMSPTLKRMVDGAMMDADELRLSFDTDNRTLALFCEFAYTWCYTVEPKPQGETSTRIDEHEAEDTDEIEVKTEGSCTLTAGSTSRDQGLIRENEDADEDHEDEADSEISSICQEEHETDEDKANELSSPLPGSQDAIGKDFPTQACIAHARLIIFADFHGVKYLASDADCQLRDHLETMEGNSHGPVTGLLISTPYFNERLDDIVAEHITENITDLWDHQPLRRALEDRPRLLAKVIDRLIQRPAATLEQRNQDDDLEELEC